MIAMRLRLNDHGKSHDDFDREGANRAGPFINVRNVVVLEDKNKGVG